MRPLRVLALVLSVVGAALLFTLSQTTPVGAAKPAPQVFTLTKHDVSRPLTQMQGKPVLRLIGKEQPLHRLEVRNSGVAPDAGEEPDGALDLFAEEEGEGEKIPAPLAGWNGIAASNSFCNCAPPDTNGDVGPNHYVQSVNTALQIWDKNNNSLLGPIPNNALFSGFGGKCETTNDGDPIILYDHLADRWFFSQFANVFSANGPYIQCFAVSTTGDPTGSWYRYQLTYPGGNVLNDYAKFGVWQDGYYMTVNQFQVTNNGQTFTWAGTGAWAIERATMLNGQATQAVYFDQGPNDWGGMLPSDLDGPAPANGTPNYFLEVQERNWDKAHIPQDRIQVYAFHADWNNPANSTFNNIANLPVAAFNGVLCTKQFNPCVPQKGTPRKLDTLADRTMYRAQYRNFGSYGTIVTNHTVNAGNNRAGIRWYEIRVTGGVPSIYQQSTFAKGDLYRWMGSAAMDEQGNIAIGYSQSSPTRYPQIAYAGRLATDPLNKLSQGSAVMKKGKGSQTGTFRWGDYSMLSVDPSDGCTFWYTTEYLKKTSAFGWKTWIGKFKFPGCS